MYPNYWCMYCFVNAHPTCIIHFLVIGFITLVAPVTGVATLGFLLRWRKVPLVMVVLQVY